MAEAKPVYNFLFYCLYLLLGWAVRLLYPLRVLGKEHLVKRRGFVLCPNHLRAIDPLFVLLARGLGKKMLIMGKDELFHSGRALNFFWKVVGAFPVNRGTGNKAAVQHCVQEVRGGRGLLVFPEGTRSKTGALGRLKSGAFVVAQSAGANIIPCAIYYSAGKPKLFRRITVVFGAPLPNEALGLTGPYSPKNLRGAKQLLTGVLLSLQQQATENT